MDPGSTTETPKKHAMNRNSHKSSYVTGIERLEETEGHRITQL